MIRPICAISIFAVLVTHACSDTEMAGVGGQLSKKKKISSPTGTPGFGCVDASAVGSPGQSVEIELAGITLNTSVSVQDNIGTASINGSLLIYQSPASVPESRDVLLTVKDGSKSATCTIKLIGDGKLLLPDDGKTRALLANVYKLDHEPNARDREVYNLPDLATLTPKDSRFMAPNVNVPATKWSAGFPSAPDLTEWFAIKFYGKINIPADGDYWFKFAVLDDGAKVYIDDRLVLNWDQLSWPEVVAARQPAMVNLTKGAHNFRVEYFQGPRDTLGVVLHWKIPGASNFTLVPTSSFDRPD